MAVLRIEDGQIPGTNDAQRLLQTTKIIWIYFLIIFSKQQYTLCILNKIR